MKPAFRITLNKGNDSTLTLNGFTETHSLQVDFGNNDESKEYCFTFVNDSSYSKLSFTFITEIELCAYFKFTKKGGRFKYVGYEQLKDCEHTVNIADYSEFSIFIPQKGNEDIRTILTLTAIKAS